MFLSSRCKYAFLLKIKANNGIDLLSACSELCNSKVAASPLLRNQRHLTVLSNAKRNSFQLIQPYSALSGSLARSYNRVHIVCVGKNSLLITRLCNRFASNYNKSAVISLQRSFLSRYSASTIMSSNCKKFCFDDYDIIGFDLDCTLLRYNINEMIPLVYELLRKFLVEKKFYPRSLLQQKLDKSFMQKGLILDAENGNILKLSGDGTILRAAHGTKMMAPEDIIEAYGVERKWHVSSQFLKDPLSTWNGPLSEKMRTLLDYFDFSASLVFAQAVDLIDAKAASTSSSKPPQYNVWPDIQEGLIEIYSRENFSNAKSEYFAALKAQPDRYLRKTSSNVIKWIKELRTSGKSLFLLTGSNIDFANLTASFSLGSNWQELFDSVVCFAKKPGFFVFERPYLEIETCALSEIPNSQINLGSNLQMNRAYSQGNWGQLRRALALKFGKDVSNVRSLYLGDNLIQDVYTPVKHRDLDTVAVCEELLAENSSGTSFTKYEYAEILSSPFWDHVAEKSVTHKFFCENAYGYYPKPPAALAV